MIYLLLLIVLLSPSLALSQTWPNQPTNGVIVSDHNFTVCEANGWTGNCGFLRSDATAPHSPPNIMRWEYDTSTGEGGGDVWIPLNQNEIWVGYWFKLSNSFFGFSTLHNKLSFGFDGFFGNGYWTKAYGTPGSGQFFMEFHLQGSDTSIDNCNVPGGYGECFNRAWNGSTQLTLGVWHRIELYYKHASSDTANNGTAKLWLDGQLELNLTGLDTPLNEILDWHFTPTWTGPPDHSSPDQISFDHVRVMQCANCSFGGADVTPPNPVQGITVE